MDVLGRDEPMRRLVIEAMSSGHESIAANDDPGAVSSYAVADFADGGPGVSVGIHHFAAGPRVGLGNCFIRSFVALAQIRRLCPSLLESDQGACQAQNQTNRFHRTGSG